MKSLAILFGLMFLVSGLALIPTARAGHTFDAVTFDAVAFESGTVKVCGAGGGSVGTSSQSWTHTTDTTRPNRLLVVFVKIGTSDVITVAEFAGQSLILLRSDTLGSNTVYTYYLRNPSTGTVTISFSATVSPVLYSMTFYNVDQSGSTFTASTAASSAGDSDGAFSTSVTSLRENLVLDAFSLSAGADVSASVADAGQTQRVNRANDGASATNCLGSSTLAATGASTTMGWTFPTGSDALIVALSIRPTSISDSGGPPGGGGQPAFPADLEAACPLSSFDWLVANPVTGHRDISIYDGRSEAALAVLYIVSWGDGKQDTKATTPINHTYQKDDIYQITVRVQYRTGLIEVFITQADVRGNNCALQKFAAEYMGILLMLAVLFVITATIVIASRRRLSADKRRLFSKAFLWLGVGILATVLAIAIYALLAGIPI